MPLPGRVARILALLLLCDRALQPVCSQDLISFENWWRQGTCLSSENGDRMGHYVEWPLMQVLCENDRVGSRFILDISGEPGTIRSVSNSSMCLEATQLTNDIESHYLIMMRVCTANPEQQFFLSMVGKKKTLCLTGDRELCFRGLAINDFVVLSRQGPFDNILARRFSHVELGAPSWRLKFPTLPSREAEMSAFRAVLFCSHVLVVLSLIVISGKVFCLYGVRHCCKSLTRKFRTVWVSCFRGPHSARMRDVVCRQRLVLARTSIPACLLFLTLALSRWLGYLRREYDAWDCSTATSVGNYPCQFEFVRRLLYDSEVVPFVMALPAFLFLFAFPSQLTTRKLDLLNVYLTIVMIVQAQAAYNYEKAFHNDFFSTWLTAARLLQYLLCGNALLTMPLQVGYDFITVALHPDASLPRILPLLIVILGSVLIIESARWVAAEAMIEAQKFSHSEGLVTQLLSGLNDAVVHLDVDLHITRESPRLATLLMHMRPNEARMAGVSFLDLCSAEDQPRIRESLNSFNAAGPNSDEVAINAMTIRVRDALGVTFSVELNWVFLPGEQECFVLGIREASDSSRVPDSIAQPAWANAALELLSSTSDSQSLLSSMEVEEEVDDGSQTQLPSDLSLMASDPGVELIVLVDAKSFRILRSNGRFDHFVGEAATSKDFRKFFLDAAPFEKWWGDEKFGSARELRTQRVSDLFVFRRRHSGGMVGVSSGRVTKVPYEVALEVMPATELDATASTASTAANAVSVKVTSHRRLGFKRSVFPGGSREDSSSSFSSSRAPTSTEPVVLGARSA